MDSRGNLKSVLLGSNSSDEDVALDLRVNQGGGLPGGRNVVEQAPEMNIQERVGTAGVGDVVYLQEQMEGNLRNLSNLERQLRELQSDETESTDEDERENERTVNETRRGEQNREDGMGEGVGVPVVEHGNENGDANNRPRMISVGTQTETHCTFATGGYHSVVQHPVYCVNCGFLFLHGVFRCVNCGVEKLDEDLMLEHVRDEH